MGEGESGWGRSPRCGFGIHFILPRVRGPFRGRPLTEEIGPKDGGLSRAPTPMPLLHSIFSLLFLSEADLPLSHWEMVGRSTHPSAFQNMEAQKGEPREEVIIGVGRVRSGSHAPYPFLGPLFINTGEALAGRWWACLPTPQASLSKGATRLWEMQKIGLALLSIRGNQCSIFPPEAFYKGQRRIWHL